MRKYVVAVLAVQAAALAIAGIVMLLLPLINRSPLRCSVGDMEGIVVTAEGKYASVASSVNDSIEQFELPYADLHSEDVGTPVYSIRYSLLRNDRKLTIIEAQVVRSFLDKRELIHPTGAVIEDFFLRDTAIVDCQQMWVNTTDAQSAQPLWVGSDEWLTSPRTINLQPW